jgi:WD40 repeat protein
MVHIAHDVCCWSRAQKGNLDIVKKHCSQAHLTKIECMQSNGSIVASGSFDSSILLWDCEVCERLVEVVCSNKF